MVLQRRKPSNNRSLITRHRHTFSPSPSLPSVLSRSSAATVGVVMLLATSFLLVEGISGGSAYTVPISKSATVSISSSSSADRTLYDTNDTILKEENTWGICKDWVNTPNDLYYHVVYGLFLFGFLAPGNNFGWIWIRSAVVVGSIMMFYSAWFHECDQEKVIWAIMFFIINLTYLTLALIKLRPVKFDKEIEAVSFMFMFIFFHVYYFFTLIHKLTAISRLCLHHFK